MKLTNKHFQLFKKECEYWINRFGLKGYKVYYHFGGNREGAFCTIQIETQGRVASLFLAKDFYDEDDLSIIEKIRETAKHECIHMLLGRMSALMRERYITELEEEQAEEELVRCLERLILK